MAKSVLLDGSKAIEIKSIDSFLNEAFLGVAQNPTHNPLHIYATVAYLYRCVDVRANALLAMPWSIYRGETELVRHDVDEWPKELAAFQSLEELLWQTEAALCLVSEAYWYKRRSRLGVTNVRWLDPSTMEPVWGVDSITAFKRTVGVAVSQLSVEDVVYLRMAGTSETMPRPAPAQAALSAAGVLYNVNEFASAFFKRGAIKATLLTVDGNPPPAERERLKSWWQRFMTGINKAFAAEVVSAAVTPVVIGEGLSELTNTELTATEREEIATALGVPHSLVMSNAANYATAEADRLTFYDMTVVPQANAIARQLNSQLFAPAGMRFEWHPQEMQIYQVDENERASAFATYVNAGIKQSIAAQMLGLNLPEGVTPEDLDPEPQPQQLQQAPQDAQGANNGVQDTQGQGQQGGQGQAQVDARQQEARKFLRWAKGKKAPDVSRFTSDILTDDDKRALLGEHDHDHETEAHGSVDLPELPFEIAHGSLTHDGYKAMVLQLDPDDGEAEQRIRMALEKRTARELGRAISDMLETLYPDGWAGDWTRAELEAIRVHNAFVRDQKLRDALSRALLDGVDLGISVGVQQLENVGFGFDWTLAHIPARDWAIAYTDDILEQLAQVTARGVGQSIGRWLENGEPLQALIDDLQPFFGPERAARIAATEVTRAVAEGSEVAHRESGVVQEQEWASSMDERVCPICSGLTGKRRKFGEPFSIGIAKPPAHVNCRCWLRPVIKEPRNG